MQSEEEAVETAIENTRMEHRRALIFEAKSLLNDRLVAIEGGALDGVEVASADNIREVLDALEAAPLPPIDLHAGEVRTPATVYVDAVCPRCGIASRIIATMEPELRVDAHGSELRLHAKAKARSHLCGQLTLPAPSDEDQVTLEDILGETPSVEVLQAALRHVMYDTDIPAPGAMADWSDLEKRGVLAWATAEVRHRTDDSIEIPARPSVLQAPTDVVDEDETVADDDPDDDALLP